MCGRFALSISPVVLARLFQLKEAPELPPRFNIAPGQDVAAIQSGRRQARRILEKMRWGLIPVWAKDPALGRNLINARSETVTTRPAFRSPLRRQRCVIPASGFYEWRATGRGKQPYFIRPRQEECFALAGLWSRWAAADGQVIKTCTILTCPANDLLRPIHDRMPVILPAEHLDLWLNPDFGSEGPQQQQLQQLLRPSPATGMTAYPVSPKVNTPAHDAPDCLEPLTDRPAAQADLFDG